MQSSKVAETVQVLLASSPYPAIRSLQCEWDDGVVVLHGTLPSYYYKQLAQETVRKVGGAVQVLNAVDVSPA